MQKKHWMSKVILFVSLTVLIAFVGCDFDSIDTYAANELASRGKPSPTIATKQEVTPPVVPYVGIQGDVIPLEVDSFLFLREYTVDLDPYVLNPDVPMEYIPLTDLVFYDVDGNVLESGDSVSYTYQDYQGVEQTIEGPAGAVRVKIGQEKTQYFTQQKMEEFITGYYAQSYGLWAGQHNDAGTVTITNDDTNFYILIDTNDAADLREVHMELYVNAGELPSKRPAPGQMMYSQEQINADSVEFIIPIPEGISVNESGEIIKSDFYFIIHAALIEDGVGMTDGTSLAGETAYAAGNEEPGYEGKGVWFYAIQYNVVPFVESFFAGYCTPIDVYVDVFAPLTVVEDNNGEDPFVGHGETAFAGNSAGTGSSWWFYIDASGNYDETTVHAIYAGQHLVEGATVTYEKSEGLLNIILGDNMRLKQTSEAVKIQGYDTLPPERPSAGQFDTKLNYGDTLEGIQVGTHTYLVVHFDAVIRN